MLRKSVTAIVDICTRYSVQVIGIAVLLAVVCGIYAHRHFAIDADVNKLISKELPWRQREAAFDKSFPVKEESILAVIDAPTSELAAQATSALIEKLQGDTKLFKFMMEAGGGQFFQRNGLLFLPAEQVITTARKLGEAKPVIQALAQDPNLRGLTTALNYGLIGVKMKHYTLDDIAGTMNLVAATFEDVIAGKPASFSWHEMLNGRPATESEKRRFIEIRPVLDFSALMPGQAATDAIRQAAKDLKFDTVYRAQLRLTGPVAIADEEFATVQEGAVVNTTATIADRSDHPVAGAALVADHRCGVHQPDRRPLDHHGARPGDGGRAQPDLGRLRGAVRRPRRRFRHPVQRALPRRASRRARPAQGADQHRQDVGAPLTLAAAATAAGFLAFLPTDYKGVSELGQIAGLGMIVAFITSITVIPALLTILKPPGEPAPDGLQGAGAGRPLHGAPPHSGDRRHRRSWSLAGLPLLYFLQFDFNPLNLRSAKVESVATFLDAAQRSEPRRQLDLRARTQQRGGARGRREAREGAGSRGA